MVTGSSLHEPVLFGQEAAVSQIEPFLDPGPLPNILLLGAPGSGKTHMGRWIAFQKQTPYLEHLCPVTASQAPGYGVWMLDECHRQTRPEQLFPIMENQLVTVVGTTTQPHKLDPAFRDRFFLRLHLEPLSRKARRQLLRHHLPDAPDDDLVLLAKASAGNPRQAHRLITTAKALGTTNPEQVLAAVRINVDGLDDVHLKILEVLARNPRPLGLSTLALLARCDELTVTEHEVLLVDLELLELSSAGRTLTDKGRKYARAVR